MYIKYSMDYFTFFTFIIILVKVTFVLLVLYHTHLKRSGKSNTNIDTIIKYWIAKLEATFIILMSLLLIFLFNPSKNRLWMINKETKYLLFLFGIILLLTTDWTVLVKPINQ